MRGKGAYSHVPKNKGKYGLSIVCKDSQAENTENIIRYNNSDIENVYCTFLNCSFIGNTLLTAGDDGYLYLWEGYRIVRRIFAHEGAIYALHVNSKLGLIVSGGMEGIVNLWRLLTEQKS